MLEGRDRLTEEIRRLRAALDRDARTGRHDASALSEIQHLERARAIAFDGAPLSPDPDDGTHARIDEDPGARHRVEP